MKTTRVIFPFCLVVGIVVLSGCSTPKPILDLAGQGAASVGLAEISLRDYLAQSHAQLNARMELMRQDAQLEAHDRARRALDSVIDRRAGGDGTRDASNLIRDLGEEARKIRESEKVELEKIKANLTLDTATLAQVPSEKLAIAKKSFATLAQELSPQEWVSLLAAYAKEIQTGLANIKTSLDDAKSKTANP